MTTRIAINGFGRIGRCVLRAYAAGRRGDVEVVAINAPSGAALSAHLLQYDSTHGVYDKKVSARDGFLRVGDLTIRHSAHRDAKKLSWESVDVLLECTGLAKNRDLAAAHLRAGAKKVLLAAPAKDADATVVFGVNDDILQGDEKIVSCASCTTNCLAPIAKVLDELAGIVDGKMTTVHAYTGDQRLLDGSHEDWRRARGAATSIVPTKTGAAAAIGLVLPSLAGKLSGVSVRVPTANVSLLDLTCLLNRKVTADEINTAMKTAAAAKLKNILAVNESPLVSVDFIGRCESSIFDATQTLAGGKLCKVFAWYDNEWGFANRMLDVAAAMMK